MKKKFLLLVIISGLFFTYSCKKNNIYNINNTIVNNQIDDVSLKKIEDVEDLICASCENVANYVVGITCSNTAQIIKNVSSGSGVIIKKLATSYYIVTNRHVILSKTNKPYDDYKIYLSNLDIYLKANLVYYSEDIDIALLELETELELLPAKLCTNKLRVGMYTISVGNPYVLETYANTINIGHLSSANRKIEEKDLKNNKIVNSYIQHNSLINEGDSGGGIFNIYGELIGINTWKLVDSTSHIEGMGFGISINTVLEELEQYL